MVDEISELILKKLDSLEKRMDELDDRIAEAKVISEGLELNEPKEDSNSREYITEHILENFDFDKCARIMKFLEWTWVDAENRIPTATEIRNLAENLFVHAWRDLDDQTFDENGWRDWMVSTGGLEVHVYEGNERCDNKRLASLKFVAEEESVE